MESLFNSYTSDDENESLSKEGLGHYGSKAEMTKEMDVNYESVTMDMSEDSSSESASNQTPQIEDTVRKKYGRSRHSSSSTSDSSSDSASSRDSSPRKSTIVDREKDKSRSKTKERSPASPYRRRSKEKSCSRDRPTSKYDDRRSKDRKSTDRKSSDRKSTDRKSSDRNGKGSSRRSRDRSSSDRHRSRSREKKSHDNKRIRRDRDEDLDKRDRKKDRDRDRSSRKRYSRSPSDKDRYRSKQSRSHRSRSRSQSRRSKSRSQSRRSKSRSHSRRRSRSRSSSGSPHHRNRYQRLSSRDNRRGKDRPHNRPGFSSYAYEKTKNKLHVLEKLGIELKVPPEIPHYLPNMNSNLTGGHVNPQSLLQQTLKEEVEKVKSATGIELPSYYNPAAVNPTKYAEQIQKRRLLWGNKDKQLNNASAAPQPTQPTATAAIMTTTTAATVGGETIWQGAKFGDQDGKVTAKFQRLMGIKQPSTAPEQAPSSSSSTPGAEKSELLKKQEEMFTSMESQYEVARLATHTHRGVGLGFGTFQYPR